MKIEIVKLDVRWESDKKRKGEPYRYANKLYIWPEGETMMENLYNRSNRPSKVWKEEVIPVVMEAVKEQFPEEYKILQNEKWGWRQKCGCSCPCSPGFVGRHSWNRTISVSIKFS